MISERLAARLPSSHWLVQSYVLLLAPFVGGKPLPMRRLVFAVGAHV